MSDTITPSSSSSITPSSYYANIDKTIFQRLEYNPWDTAGWQLLLANLDSVPLQQAIYHYNKALRIFPSNGYIITLMGKRYLAEGNINETEALLQKYLLTCYDIHLWNFYTEFVYETKYETNKTIYLQITNPKNLATANANDQTAAQQRLHAACNAVIQTYEFALSRMGYAYHSHTLWVNYIKFLSDELNINTLYSKGQIIELRRKAYQRAISVPHEAVDKLWMEYQKFEKDNSPEKLAETLITQRQSEYGTATAVYKERSTLWKAIDNLWLPTPPPLDSELILPTSSSTIITDTYITDSIITLRNYRTKLSEQLIHWRRLIGYELSNPLHVSKEIMYEIVRLHFRQCTSLAGKYAPEIWNDYANYERDISSSSSTVSTTPSGTSTGTLSAADNAALTVYTNGINIMPACASLALITADFHEIGGRITQAMEIYTNLLTSLHSIAERTQGRKGIVSTTNNNMDTDTTTSLSSSTTESMYPILDALDTTSSYASLHILTLLATSEDAQQAANTIPLIYILQQRAARRMEGIPAARSIFANARKSPFISPIVYFASAQLEYYTNRNIEATRNILEAGRKKFTGNIDYLLSCLDFLANIDDSTNMKAFFENAIKSSNISPNDSRPLWDRYIQYEMMMTQGGSSLHSIINIEKARARIHPYLETPDIPLLMRNYHRYNPYGLLPSYRIDTDVLQRFPYQPTSVIQLSASSAAALLTNTTNTESSNTTPLSSTSNTTNNIITIGYPHNKEIIPKYLYEGHYLQVLSSYHNSIDYLPITTLLSNNTNGLPLINELNGSMINNQSINNVTGVKSITSSTTSSSTSVGSKYLDVPNFLKSLLSTLPAYDSTVNNATLPDVDTIINKLMHYNSHTNVLLNKDSMMDDHVRSHGTKRRRESE